MQSFSIVIHFSNRLYQFELLLSMHFFSKFRVLHAPLIWLSFIFCSNNILWKLLQVTYITHYCTSRIYKNILASWQSMNSLSEHHKYLLACCITNAINNKFLAWNKFITLKEHVLASPVHNNLYSRFRGYWLRSGHYNRKYSKWQRVERQGLFIH
jgi:hypothetical protein